MASPQSSVVSVVPSIGFPVTEKLTRANFREWRAQVWSALRGAQLAGYVDGSIVKPEATITTPDAKEGDAAVVSANLAYEKWIVQDQQVLNFLFSSLSRDIMTQVAVLDSAATIWAAIEAMFALQSRARVINTRMALATAHKGTSTEYFTKMKGLADEMASTGKKLEDEKLVSYILAGLD